MDAWEYRSAATATHNIHYELCDAREFLRQCEDRRRKAQHVLISSAHEIL